MDYNIELHEGWDDYSTLCFAVHRPDGEMMETTKELDAALDRIIPSLFENDFKDVMRTSGKRKGEVWVRRHHYELDANDDGPRMAICYITIHWDDWYEMKHRGLRKILRDHPWYLESCERRSANPQPVYKFRLGENGKSRNLGMVHDGRREEAA